MVPAFELVAPPSAKVGGSAQLHLYNITANDPPDIQLLLLLSEPYVRSILATDEPVNATMYASIPYRIPARWVVVC